MEGRSRRPILAVDLLECLGHSTTKLSKIRLQRPTVGGGCREEGRGTWHRSDYAKGCHQCPQSGDEAPQASIRPGGEETLLDRISARAEGPTYLKEQQRFQTDVLKLQDEIREAKLQEDAAKQHLVPHGDSGMEEIFPGMDCDGEAAALDATGLMGPGGESQQLGVTGSSKGRGGTFSMHQASMGDNTRSPGMMEDLELQSLLQATSGTLGGHQDTPVPSGIGRGLPPQHAAQRIQVPAMPVLASQLSTPVRKEGSAAAQNLGLDKLASQDPYQFVGGMTPSAPVISGQGRHHVATASVEESISGPPWYPSTSPTLKKSPNTRESVGRRPIKQVTKKPATRTSPNGPSLADKLEKLRECSGQVGVQIPSGNVPPLAVGPTAPETSQALRELIRELTPAALPQQFVIYDDEDSAGDISDADPEFLAWAASMAGDSKLPEMD